MGEFLSEFAQYTPRILLRFIADGETAVLWVMPNIVGMITYAFIVNMIIEKMIGIFFSTLFRVRMFFLITDLRRATATPLKRFLSYFPLVIKNLLKGWIGIPVLYVLSLSVSNGNIAIETLRKLVTGYSWQRAVIGQLPLHTWLNIGQNSSFRIAISLIAGFFYLNNRYVYYANGFFLDKRIREVGDAVLRTVADGTTVHQSPNQVIAALKNQGWPDEAVSSALFFLAMTNMRIVWQNQVFRDLSPRIYGLYRVTISLGVILILKELHPLVAVLKVFFEKQDIGEVRRLMWIFKKRLQSLPSSIQAKLSAGES